ncbi:MAG: hypothetical protein M1833_006147 [Piccolia ochrophora]|nr:MAG: hypothetical protein M1833_006147 [Piccolia ochrophora]
MSSESELDDPKFESERSSPEAANNYVKSASGSDVDDEELEPRAGRRKGHEATNGNNKDDSDTEGDGQSKGAKEEKGDEGDEGDLFGSASEDEGEGQRRNTQAPLELPYADTHTSKTRQLDDEDIDSGDDEDRQDRMLEDTEQPDAEEVGNDARVMDLELARHGAPQGSDEELYILKFPPFLGLEPTAFHPKAFHPPQTTHQPQADSSTFSAYGTALNTLRWRKSPQNPSQLESNARIIRWSDGSLTLQLGSDPKQQFELPSKALAPPQMNPRKPTPTSKTTRTANGAAPYNSQLDSHTYLTSPHESAGLLRVTHHITTSLTVLPSSEVNDEALTRLEESIQAAGRRSGANADGSINLIEISEDPELARKKAEIAERDRLRNARKIAASQAREAERASRSLARSGLMKGGVGGLSVGGLEDDDTLGSMRTGRKRAGPAAPRRRQPRNRDSDTDDDLPRGRTREDEYDKTDDFLVDSDEDEGEEAEEDDEEEEISMDEASEKQAPARRKASPKRPRAQLDKDELIASAAAAEAATAGPRSKRRRVIDEDDDEE